MITTAQPVTMERAKIPALYQVWIDLKCGRGDPDWWWNTPPKPLADALAESQNAKSTGWVMKILPEGQNPRADGRWDNP